MLLLISLAMLLCTVSPVLAAGEARDALTVGVPNDRCPIFYQDADTGEAVGIGVDLMRIAAEDAGYAVSFVFVEEETLKEALDNPAYDVVMPFGSAVSSASGGAVIVSDNLFQTPFTLVTTDKGELPSLNSLRVGMPRSLAGGAETVSQLYPGMEIVFYETMEECVKALRSGEVDALLHNSYVWSYVLQKPSYTDLLVQPLSMFSMDFRAGTLDTPEGRETIDRLNDGIAQLTDPQRQAIILDYSTRSLYQYDFFDYIYQYGLFLLLIVLLLVALIVIVVLRWQTLRFAQEKKMRYIMSHDALTGMLNLNGFRKRVEELLRAHPDIPYLLSYCNIKNFKYINDRLGMKAGDELLCFWAQAMQDALPEDSAFGRLEGDHFAFLHRVGGEEQMALLEKYVFDPVRNYFVARNHEIRVQVCAGIYALTPDDYQRINVDHMIDFARVAEKRVREEQVDGFEFYNPKQWRIGKLITDVVGHLPKALKTGEIKVWYQPQVDYENGKIIGAEALCRWNPAEQGWISPAEFIPALEEAGLIYDLDRYVWDRVCQDLRRWKAQGHHRIVSVNLSRADFTKGQNIPEHFKTLIETYGLTPDQLHIEITETAYVDHPELLVNTTEKLRAYGFQVEMDDFGSGYSSLNMLKEVQLDRIKLDLRFLTETGDAERGRVIVTHVIWMAQSLGMNLIAEGVEQEEQARFLQSQGCSEMQGYYFYKPMPCEDYENLL